MTPHLTPYLEDLVQRLDPAQEARLMGEWKAFLNGQCPTPFFRPVRKPVPPRDLAWPAVAVNDTLEDNDSMALHQMTQCSGTLAGVAGFFPCVRCNYGVGILPSLFGAELFIMPREMNNMPNSLPLGDGADAIRAMLDRGMPDLRTGLGGRVLDMGAYFKELFAPYPTLAEWIPVYHPDLQGPMDACELLWGSAIFYDMVDSPELVHQALNLITDTYIAFMKEWWKVAPPRAGFNVHWGMLHKGNIMLRDDSAMNLSPEMYREFILPYNQRCLDALGGGALHACGRVDHWAPVAAELSGLTALNFSQPELNDMESVFSTTVDRGIPLINLSPAATEAALANGRPLHGRVHRA